MGKRDFVKIGIRKNVDRTNIITIPTYLTPRGMVTNICINELSQVMVCGLLLLCHLNPNQCRLYIIQTHSNKPRG